MGKILVFLYDTMAGFEMSFASYLIGNYSDREVIGIGYEKKPVRDSSGVFYSPTLTVSEAIALPDVEGLIIPGGRSGDCRPELVALIQKLDREQRLLAAICAGPMFLALAGVLNGRRFTTSLAEWDDDAREHYRATDPFPRATYTGSRMVRDGHIVTAIGYAFADFGIEIADGLGLFESPEERAKFEAVVHGTKA